MNDQQQSRADALTEAQRKALETAVNVLNINWEHETANELWEAFTAPVSQPAAAPADERAAFEAWRDKRAFNLPSYGGLAEAYAWDAWQARAASANETGAEGAPIVQAGRDVLVTHVPSRIYLNLGDINELGEIPFQQLTGVTWCEDRVDDTDIEYVRAPAQAAEQVAQEVPLTMALNPNAPPLTMALGPAQAAEPVAQWQSRLKDRSSPVVDHWVNISPDGAKTLMEKYADVYEVRALYTAPRSPAMAAEAAAIPAGWKLVRVNEHFDALIAALERAESKGYLPDSIREEWENFACDENAPQPAQADAPADTACPHAGVHRYCMSCPVSPCPIGLGEKK